MKIDLFEIQEKIETAVRTTLKIEFGNAKVESEFNWDFYELTVRSLVKINDYPVRCYYELNKGEIENFAYDSRFYTLFANTIKDKIKHYLKENPTHS